MKIQSLKLVYFSPTGTTKAVVQGIARGIDQSNAELIDITLPDARKQSLQTSDHDLLIIGVPVYVGRVPALCTEWLQAVDAHNTPAVCVVVYGNRAYEDALVELKDTLTQRGCKPIAGAAYIGKHSFSNDEPPTASDRPDAGDLDHAESFGRQIQEKLNTISSADQISDVPVPGCHPYRGEPCAPYRRGSKFWNVDFIAVSDECVECGICAQVCPVGAIDPDNSSKIDTETCITCCACIKNCPNLARTIKPGMVRDAALRISTLYKERKEPEIFV